MTTQPTGELAGGAMDRVLVLEMVRVTEAAAMAAASMIGRGDEKAADAAAVEAMRAALNDLYMDGTVVIGEGERDEAPMLYIGEKVGNAPGKGPKIDIALDPLEGTTITAKAGPNAMAVLAVAEEGNLLNAPDVYMEKLAVGPGYSHGIIDLAKTPTENVLAVAKEKGVPPEEIIVCVLDRPRHDKLIAELRSLGCGIMLIPDGDVAGVIATTNPDTTIDLYMGSGGAPEGVLAAAALRCVGGQFKGRLLFRNDDERLRARKWGIEDLDKIYDLEELAKGDCIFAATGVTSGSASLSGTSSALTATNTIADNDTAVVSIANTTNAAEPGTNGSMTVTLSAASGSNTVVSYSVAGTATSGTDYTALTGSVTIPAGQTSATISIPVIDDNAIDPGETVIVTLTAVTSGTAELSSTPANITATNTITDNEGNNAPTFTNTNSLDGSNAPAYTFSYAENSTTSTTLGTVTASDAESDPLTFSITGGNSNGWYAIDATTGVITLTTGGVASIANDFEQTANTRAITVTVSDGALSQAIQVTLNETNVNDGTPVFTGTNSTGTGNAPAYSFNYAENSATGSTLGTLTASDSDGNTLTFSLTGGNSSGWYAIDPSTGVITLTSAGAASLANDYEVTPNTRTLTATVSDGTNSTTIEVKLNETNVNDATPAFTNTNATGSGNLPSYNFDYTEGAATGVTIATVSASDGDADTLTFSITGGDSNNWYTINSSTGAISLTVAGAASVANNYSSLPNSRVLTVTVSDGVNSSTVEVQLDELSGANGAPGFTNTNATGAGNAAAYSFNYAENSASGATLGTVSASDPEGNPLTFAISAGNGSGWYAIDPSTGAITLTATGAASLANDFERAPNTQTLTVTVSDGTSTTSIEVRLNETNVNDTAPVFSNTNATGANNAPAYSFNYAENTANGASLGTINATDAEGGTLTFSITGGNANGWYAIDTATGVITLTPAGAASQANDFEQAPNSQTLTVSASDGTNSATIEVSLSETNANDVPPVINGPSGGQGAAASVISTMNVERPLAKSSAAPMRVKMRSIGPMVACVAGT